MPRKGQFKRNAKKRSVQQRRYNSRPQSKKDRAKRNKARRAGLRSGRVRKGDGKDIHHVNGRPGKLGNRTRVISRSKNRSMGGRVGGSR